MRVSITNAGHTDHTGRELPAMAVDGHLVLLDLTSIGQLWDPTVASISWGPTVKNGEVG
jgi:hypothetical protein